MLFGEELRRMRKIRRLRGPVELYYCFGSHVNKRTWKVPIKCPKVDPLPPSWWELRKMGFWTSAVFILLLLFLVFNSLKNRGSGKSCQGKITTTACYFLPPQIFLSVCVSFFSMADLLLLMLAKYSWIWAHNERILTSNSPNIKIHLMILFPRVSP